MEKEHIVEIDQSLWDSSNAYYNLKNSNNSGNYDSRSLASAGHSSNRTVPVKLQPKGVLDDSDLNDTDEKKGSPTRSIE